MIIHVLIWDVAPALFRAFLQSTYFHWFVYFLLQSEKGDEELCSVYVPTNHLYIGDIFLVNSEDIIRPNLSIREGIGLVHLSLSCSLFHFLIVIIYGYHNDILSPFQTWMLCACKQSIKYTSFILCRCCHSIIPDYAAALGRTWLLCGVGAWLPIFLGVSNWILLE